MYRSFTTAAILALAITAAHADDFASTRVTFGDLDLSQPADAKILADRLENAAKSVCIQANPDDVAPTMLQNCITGGFIRGGVGSRELWVRKFSPKLLNFAPRKKNP